MRNDLPPRSTEAMTEPGEPGTLAQSVVEARPDPVGDECAALMAAVDEQTAAVLPSDAPDPNATTAPADLDDGELEELALPSLVRAPDVLASGTVLGPDARVRIVE